MGGMDGMKHVSLVLLGAAVGAFSATVVIVELLGHGLHNGVIRWGDGFGRTA